MKLTSKLLDKLILEVLTDKEEFKLENKSATSISRDELLLKAKADSSLEEAGALVIAMMIDTDLFKDMGIDVLEEKLLKKDEFYEAYDLAVQENPDLFKNTSYEEIVKSLNVFFTSNNIDIQIEVPEPEPEPKPEPPGKPNSEIQDVEGLKTIPDIYMRGSLTDSKKTGMDILQNISNSMFGGSNVEERIKSLCDVLNNFNDKEIQEEMLSNVNDVDQDGTKGDDKLSTLLGTTFLGQMLQQITQYNPTSAGFYFENWVISMFGEATKGEAAGAVDIKIGDEYWSLKFYTGMDNPISQAAGNIEAMAKLINDDEADFYHVLYGCKNWSPGDTPTSIDFYHLKMRPDNQGATLSWDDLFRKGKQFGTLAAQTGLKKWEFASLDFSKMLELTSTPSSLNINDDKLKQLYEESLNLKKDVELLKAYLAEYFLTFSRPAAEGVEKSAENTKVRINTLKSEKDYYQDPNQGTKPSTEELDVLERNKKYISDPKGRLPEITILQDYANFKLELVKDIENGTKVVNNQTIDKISQHLSSGGSVVENIKGLCDWINNTMDGVQDQSETVDFSNLVAFENLYRLMQSVKTIEEAGDNIAGFNFENWIAAVGGGFAAGTNQELEDMVKVYKDDDGVKVEGFGLKFKNYNAKSMLFEGAAPFNPKKYGINPRKNPKIPFTALVGAPTYKDTNVSRPEWELQAMRFFKKVINYKYDEASDSYIPMDVSSYSFITRLNDKTYENMLLTLLKNIQHKQSFPVDHWQRGKDDWKIQAEIDDFYFKTKSIGLNFGYEFQGNKIYLIDKTTDKKLEFGNNELKNSRNQKQDVKKFRTLQKNLYQKYEKIVQPALLNSKITDPDSGWEEIGSFNISTTVIDQVLTNLDKKLKASKNNFTQIFQNFNKFKYSIFSFFNDPREEFLAQAIGEYDEFKTKMNESFEEAEFSDIKINESIKALDKLILEILQESRKTKK